MKNILIFGLSNQVCGLSQSQSISDIVLKEIESPDGIKWYADFGKSNLACCFNSVRAFCCLISAKHTSTQKVVGSGKNVCQQNKGYVQGKHLPQLLTSTERYTVNETTDSLIKVGNAVYSLVSLVGRYRGENFTSSLNQFIHSGCQFD